TKHSVAGTAKDKQLPHHQIRGAKVRIFFEIAELLSHIKIRWVLFVVLTKNRYFCNQLINK
ncbi:hypothetical protein, partial [Prevotella sp.]|uniref:hypothetical protein n=1 Tax=Prevotella sp. TaxID=59823 RepID=UPI003AF5898B